MLLAPDGRRLSKRDQDLDLGQLRLRLKPEELNGRTRVEWVSAAEGVKFSETMNSFVEKVRSLGPNVRLGDIRCKN